MLCTIQAFAKNTAKPPKVSGRDVQILVVRLLGSLRLGKESEN